MKICKGGYTNSSERDNYGGYIVPRSATPRLAQEIVRLAAWLGGVEARPSMRKNELTVNSQVSPRPTSLTSAMRVSGPSAPCLLPPCLPHPSGR